MHAAVAKKQVRVDRLCLTGFSNLYSSAPTAQPAAEKRAAKGVPLTTLISIYSKSLPTLMPTWAFTADSACSFVMVMVRLPPL